MGTYLWRRFLLAVSVIWGVTLIVFLMIHLLPGDPVMVILSATNATPEQVQELRHQLRLDDPLWIQYLNYMGRTLQGDLGKSVFTGRSVAGEISDQFPATLELAVAALGMAGVLGVGLGVVAAYRRGTWVDTTAMLGALGGVSVPNFWLGLMLIFLFSLKLGWLPATGQGGWQRLVLPGLTLGLSFAAVTARLVRSTMLEVIQQDYVRTARAKGLGERVVLFRHCLRNALIPVVTIIGIQFGNLLGGTVVVETVFSRRGLGRLTVQAILDKDFPLVQGAVLVSAIGYVLINLVVDLTYAFLDPRIRYD